MDLDELLLQKCRLLIEEKLGWGHSAIWTNRDFETLSDRIEADTKIKLSVATLKRIWGKVKYNSKPTITTLDTLVQFIGYENWRIFKGLESDASRPKANGVKPVPVANQSERLPPRKLSRLMLAPVIFTILSGVIILFIFFTGKDDDSLNKSDSKDLFSFASKKVVSDGVPNSVIFHYDASAASPNDTIFIQQSWDTRLRQQVTRNSRDATSIYYYPGFFQAKLVVNNRIVKEHNLYIRSKGWLPVIEREQVPIYFEAAEATGEGVMTLSSEKILESGVMLHPEPPWVAFHNARTFSNLRSDNFIFETAVKNDYNAGAGVCQLTEIHLRLEGGMIMIPLSVKGCVGKLNLIDMDGRKADPTALGCDFSDWVNVRLDVNDGLGKLFINGKKEFDLNFKIKPVKIVGLLYRFQGTGSINFVKLFTRGGEAVYEENF